MAAPSTGQADLPIGKAMWVGICNALAFYDFLVFSFFAIQIGHTFFPESLTSRGLLLSLATSGLGFITRPAGGVAIGTYGDYVGRKRAMVLSFTLMGIASAGIALTPSYERIGIAAPFILLGLRLLQGFALGGEVGPTTALLLEAAPPHRRGLYVSIQAATQGLAILIAALVLVILSSALSSESLQDWGWRYAFLFGALVMPLGFYARHRLPETLHETAPLVAPALHFGPRAARVRIPFRLILFGLFTIGAMTTATYVLGYMNIYAQDSLQLGSRAAFGAVVINGVCFVLAAPLGGWLVDRFGRKPVMLYAMAALVVMVLPAYFILNRLHTVAALHLVTAVLSLVTQVASVSILVSVTEALPKAVRAAGLGAIYATAIALFGGSAPFIVQGLVDATHSMLAPAWYLTAALVVGVVAALAFRSAVWRNAPIR